MNTPKTTIPLPTEFLPRISITQPFGTVYAGKRLQVNENDGRMLS